MASDNHAHYSKIGLAVLLGTAAIVIVLIRLGGLGRGDDPVWAETYYDRSVSGLSVGSSVSFRGVQVGKVAAIDFVGNRYDAPESHDLRVYIHRALDRKAFAAGLDEGLSPEESLANYVKKGLRATVSASGITGLSRIECDLHPDIVSDDRLPCRPRTTYIPPKESLLEGFSSAATKVMNQINRMDLNVVWSNISTTVMHISESARSLRGIMEERHADIGQIIEDAADATSSLKSFAAELKRNPSAIIRERRAEPLDETR